jgi:tRNA pseudouridine38-40 synthase
MSRWKLVFEYDGTNFSGWQRQPDARTVEEVIEDALSKLYQQEIDIIGQGRTDAGVHAKGQVAHADLPDTFPAKRLIHAMRGLLPKDVALLSAGITTNEFHARFSATARSYIYKVMVRQSPLMRDRAWTSGYDLDVDLLSQMAGLIEKNQEFVNFCIPDPQQLQTTQSEIYRSEWSHEGDLLTYTICANRFLRHMVRRLVGSMVQVASGRKPLEWFETLLSGKEVSRKGHSAPAHGLYLEEVVYKS